MTRTRADSLRWVQQGRTSLEGAVDGLGDDDLRAECLLPGWTRAHLVAHLAANADALHHLATWALTGVVTPMYSSPAERAEGIAKGETMTALALRAWLVSSQARLDDRLAELNDEQWDAVVTTAHGREVPASEIPWLRAREVCVHAIDLGAGLGFEDTDRDFLAALADDVVATRSSGSGPALELASNDADESWALDGKGPEHAVVGTTAELVAYLTGRRPSLRTTTGAPAPALGPWL